jgi:hypothetical protein
MDKKRALAERHQKACHAMQTGVAIEKQRNGPEGEKHLRVGINVALVDQGALVQLLIDKGVISEDEYLEAIAVGMEKEVERCKERLGLPAHVSLG